MFAVKLTFEMLTVCVQQHSFSTHERMYLWICRSFWDRKCLDLRGILSFDCQSIYNITCPGRALALCWVVHVCRRFEPLFWPSGDWTRSFWGAFSHPPTPKRSFWVPILPELDIFGPKFHFCLDLLGSNFQRPVAPTHQFSDRVPRWRASHHRPHDWSAICPKKIDIKCQITPGCLNQYRCRVETETMGTVKPSRDRTPKQWRS